MKKLMAPNIPLAIVLFAAVAAAGLRAAAKRAEPRRVPRAEPLPLIVRTDEGRPRRAVASGTRDAGGNEMARPLGWSASAVEQIQHVFHELHADGRHAACAVCDGQHAPA